MQFVAFYGSGWEDQVNASEAITSSEGDASILECHVRQGISLCFIIQFGCTNVNTTLRKTQEGRLFAACAICSYACECLYLRLNTGDSEHTAIAAV